MSYSLVSLANDEETFATFSDCCNVIDCWNDNDDDEEDGYEDGNKADNESCCNADPIKSASFNVSGGGSVKFSINET